MKRETVRYWRRIAVGNLIAAAVVLFGFNNVSWRTPPRDLLRGYLISLLFSACIGPIVGVAMPHASRWIWSRTRSPFNWIAVTVLMAAMAVAGSLIAIGILVLIGQVPLERFAEWFQGSLRVAIIITLTVGLFITAYEMTRAREAQASVQAQLASLESRVQPHFLFNTLNSIAALIHDDPKGAERMTGQLASLMRTSLDQQATPLVALEDELTFVRDYLAIEQVRFGDRLRYTIGVADAARGARVPRMSVQTVVENAVKYAVSPRREGASIAITATVSTGGPPSPHAFTITVVDDGPGFDATALPAGHGLALLSDRVALIFNGRYPLRIESAPGRTVVTLTVPEIHDRPATPPPRGCEQRGASAEPRATSDEPTR